MTSGAGSTTSGVVSGSLGSREINYILRVLGPAACRNPECFVETASSCVRIALPAPRGAGTGEGSKVLNSVFISLFFLFMNEMAQREYYKLLLILLQPLMMSLRTSELRDLMLCSW